ncbi:class I SAM-dependent methyltransferase [Vibrio anguillarum]|nr:DUF4942 domain-containing protein [Vibrio anguillarum]
MNPIQSRHIIQKPSVNQLVNALKKENEDFEFYPTTSAIIRSIERNIRSSFFVREGEDIHESILDCGAGDGRLLNITKGNKYAIEKSSVLLANLDKNIVVVGTDFHEQTLIDKRVSVITSNPPYREYKEWAMKIIHEANANVAYLVLPSRWSKEQSILDAIKSRKASSNVLLQTDFYDADRQARAKVDLVKIEFGSITSSRSNYINVSPFDLWFNQMFLAEKNAKRDALAKMKKEQNKQAKENRHAMIKNDGLVNALVEHYNVTIDGYFQQYYAISQLDDELLSEMNVSIDNVKKAFQLRISSLKDRYWKELFDHLTVITDKLTSASRETLLKKITDNAHVDFTISNAHSIVLWMLKHANSYYNSQLIDTVQNLVSESNCLLYQSNQKTFGNDDWRYCNRKLIDRYHLDYRIVTTGSGQLTDEKDGWGRKNGLNENAINYINDFLTIANNLNFDATNSLKAQDVERWESGKKRVFTYFDHNKGKTCVLFEAKLHWNGNYHFRFAPKFIMALNVEFGRLMGWLRSKEEASAEMGYSLKDVENFFGTNHQLLPSHIKLLH